MIHDVFSEGFHTKILHADSNSTAYVIYSGHSTGLKYKM